ncbi:hypothetical protein V8G54_033735 [Vigna mungo]|uniref:UspA domain-containing protein n=1 Tax=Vigna mungo TaxID=3915 RepID=A0AAQ3RJ27_VIGMU
MMSGKTRHDCLHHESDEEGSSGFIQVYDCSANEMNNEDLDELFEINMKESLETISEDCESSVFSFDIHKNNDTDVVHVAVDHVGESSMEALLWTLNHAVRPSTTVYLIHVFPEIRLIPSPCESSSS